MPDLVHRRLRAPLEDGAALIDPPLKDLRAVLAANDVRARSVLPPESAWLDPNYLAPARADLLKCALAFTSAYRDVSGVPTITKATPFILTGHQPTLFHPGVWFKNFLLSALRLSSGGIAINLLIDNDTVHSPSISIPAEGDRFGIVESIAFDEAGKEMPYEERCMHNPTMFRSFAGRVKEHTVLGTTTLVDPLWAHAQTAIDRREGNRNLGQVLAESRHQLEAAFGLQSLEVPLSAVCKTPTYRWFVTHLLLDLRRLQDVYNRSLAEYRAVNRIRSRSHPVPELEGDGEWLEAPFWVWSDRNPRRRRLFVRRKAASIELSDRAGITWPLSVSQDPPTDEVCRQLNRTEADGVKLRPRALITTMYARLVLSDLFIHGIGGAKYDELTDLIIRRFFGIEPPAYVTATATFRLPIERPQVTREDVRNSARRIRETRYRPEAFVRDPLVTKDAALAEQLTSLTVEKREYLAKHDLRHCSQKVFAALDRINRAMHDLLRPVEEQLRAEHAQLIEQAKHTQLLASREFSFCLFPSEILPARLLDLCKVSS